MNRTVPAVCALLVLMGSGVFAAEPIVGRPTVISGDTLEIKGTRIRLYGVDAPEIGQLCTDPVGRAWRCGQNASWELAGYLASAIVSCQPQKKSDADGQTVAICHHGKTDLSSWLAYNGWAMAVGSDSQDYAQLEHEAKQARRNIWAGSITPPWKWHRGSGGSAPPQRCTIKGDIHSGGKRVYYTAESLVYKRVQINEYSGERWFCSEAEAVSAGWRKTTGNDPYGAQKVRSTEGTCCKYCSVWSSCPD